MNITTKLVQKRKEATKTCRGPASAKGRCAISLRAGSQTTTVKKIKEKTEKKTMKKNKMKERMKKKSRENKSKENDYFKFHSLPV